MKHHQKPTLLAASTLLALACAMTAMTVNASEDTYRWIGDNSTGKWLTEGAWEAVGEVTSTYPQSDDRAILPKGTSIFLNSAGACVSNITVESEAAATLKTDAGNTARVIYAREINGGGTLTLQGIHLCYLPMPKRRRVARKSAGSGACTFISLPFAMGSGRERVEA